MSSKQCYQCKQFKDLFDSCNNCDTIFCLDCLGEYYDFDSIISCINCKDKCHNKKCSLLVTNMCIMCGHDYCSYCGINPFILGSSQFICFSCLSYTPQTKCHICYNLLDNTQYKFCYKKSCNNHICINCYNYKDNLFCSPCKIDFLLFKAFVPLIAKKIHHYLS